MPLVGAGIDDLTTGAFGTAGEPFIYVGRELESMLILIARLLALLVVGVMVIPWLSRYLPWRAGAPARRCAPRTRRSGASRT